MAAMKQVKFPKEFFAKAKLEYSDWRWAFFREFIQNSIDAGADNIHIDIDRAPSGEARVRVRDNGCGMTRDVLENVLLVGGGSLKPNGAVGGFGYAKSLLYFAHDSYTIITNDLIVRGSGGDYTIEEGVRNIFRGCDMMVYLGNIDTTELSLLHDALVSYTGFMRTSCRVTLNGKILTTDFTDYTFKVTTDLGILLFRDVKARQSLLVVSVRGLPMFVHTVYTSGDDAFVGVLELHGKTFDLLTTNRDALKGFNNSRLTSIVQKMIEQRFSYKIGKTLDMTLNWSEPSSGSDEDKSTVASDSNLLGVVDQLRFMRNDLFPHNFNLKVQSLVGQKTEDSAENVISVNTVLSTVKKRWVQRLAFTWKFIVYEILRCQFLAKFGVLEVESDKVEFYLNGKRISAGFIFADKIEGMNSNGEHEILILCNPLLLSQNFKIPDLCDLAIHECAHLLCSGHNDFFIDADMQIRRSLRQYMDECALEEEVKMSVREWKADRLDQL